MRHDAMGVWVVGACRRCLVVLAVLASAGSSLRSEPELVHAFLFGSRSLSCPTYSDPSQSYTVVLHGSDPAPLAYDAGRGWGYEVTNPGDTSRNGFGIFGPFDESPNPRDVFGDSCPEEIYDSFIGAKNFAAPCQDPAGPPVPCLPLEGIVFRVDIPNGQYRFVAAMGSADNVHAHSLVAEDGGAGPPADLGESHVVLIDNFDQGLHGAGVFARVGFDGLIPPPAAVNGFVSFDENGLETAGDPSSPILEVTQGYLRIHQLKGSTVGSDANGGDMVLLEIWRVADTFQAIEHGSTWRFLPGTAEASSPAGAWRAVGFDDSSWESGATPIGYGETAIVTDLGSLVPPMRDNYSSLYLRQSFELSNPELVNQLVASVDYDDGFLLWINGVEVLRINVPGGDGEAVPYDAFATSGHESGLLEDYLLADPSTYLVSGTNVVAVQVLNQTITSSDLLFDLRLYDPVAPDLNPPEIHSVVPAGGTTVRSLRQLQVTFTEDVTGVDASDLLIEGSPAAGVTGSGSGPYVFTFPDASAGTVDVSWVAGHGIEDLADFPNAFSGGSWSYLVDPDAPVGSVRINEILAVNTEGITDEDGDDSEWIELYNDGAEVVNLAGWSITDEAGEPGRFVLPARSLPPGGYLVVFASGKDRAPASGNIHTNFKLSPAGEYVGIYNAEFPREVVSEIWPRYPQQHADIAYGFAATGGLAYLATPTPGAANAGSVAYDGFALPPEYAPARGLFASPVDVTIYAGTPGVTIRYTLDGSDPTPTRGTVYGSPIRIAPGGGKGAVALRAIAYRNDLLPSGVTTHTYIFPDAVLGQTNSPAGFPSSWRSQPADYEMDPEVVGDPGHTELIRRGLVAIPTLSIVTEMANLFDPNTGIYANPSYEGIAWERPTSAELIFPDGREGFHADCGIRIQGGSSTGGWKSLKVSMRLLFKEDYGGAKLRYALFPDSRVEQFDTIVLDAHLNQTWNHPTESQRDMAQYCRDQLVSDMQNAAGGYAPHDFFAHLYLNGVYWGVYDIHERADDAFAADYLGGEKEEYDCLKHNPGNVVAGSNAAWGPMMAAVRRDQSALSNYLDVWDHLDVPNFIDYMLVNYWAGNDDWDHHNWYATRWRNPAGRFRFHSWDAEHVLKSLTINRFTVNNSDRPTEIFQRLRGSPEFRMLVADHAHKHFFNGGIFHVDPTDGSWDPGHPERNVPAAMWMRRIDEVDGYVRRLTGEDPDVGSAISCEAARWGDAKESEPNTRNGEWLAELTHLLDDYLPYRSEVVLDQLRSLDLYPDVGAPILGQHGGRIDPGFSLSITRPAGQSGTIYYTTDGVDPRVMGSGSIALSARSYSSPLVLDDLTTVKARIRSGTEWSALAEATFTLSSAAELVRITEIHYHPPFAAGNTEFLELQNVGGATVSLTGAVMVDGVFLEFPKPTTLAPGEFLVLVGDPAAFAAEYPDVPIGGVFFGSLANEGERIRIVDPQGQPVLDVSYDDDGLWPLGPDGFGFSLVPVDPFGDPDNPWNWRASRAVGGSPGAEDPEPMARDVYINEILAATAPPLEGAIELANLGPTARDIGGWYLSDDKDNVRKFRIPDGTTVPPGGYVVLYENEFNAVAGSPDGFSLDPAGGRIYLASADSRGDLTGHVVEAEYTAEEPGVSIGRIPTTTGYDLAPLDARTFGVDDPGTVEEFRQGSGAENASPRFGPLVINELHYHPDGGGEEFVEIYNPTAAPIPLYDEILGRGWRLNALLDASGLDTYEFGPGAFVPAGGYLLVVGVPPDLFRRLHSVSAAVSIVGPASGALDNGGERVELLRPVDVEGGGVSYALVDRVRYNDRAPWPVSPDGYGPSLERVFATAYGNDPASWDASTLVGGTPGARNTASGSGGNRSPSAGFVVNPPGGSAPLQVLLDASPSYDLDGEIVSYSWTLGDGEVASGKTVSHLYAVPGAYSVSLLVTDDGGLTDSVSRTISVREDLGGWQLPGDGNQDGTLDISDALALLIHLFLGGGTPPCAGGDMQAGGNGILLDVNDDDLVDITDAVYTLSYLFQGGPPPSLGVDCIRIVGCPDACD